MNKKFIKNFINEGRLSSLPDSDYWLSREEIILTNLYLRGGAVPKVQIKNLINKSLTLQNAGTSLDELLSNPSFPKITESLSYKVFLSSSRKLLHLFELDTLHLDIALRNIASPNLLSNEIYILDFIHALSEHNKLQKPLPLIPTKDLHHPLLIEALELDWKNYFSNLGRPCPKLDNSLTISNEEFSNYWVQNTKVQALCKNIALLCHGLGNLAIEFSNSPNIETSSKKIFIELGKMLRNLNEPVALESLKHADDLVAKEIENISKNSIFINNATPIPIIQNDSVSSTLNTQVFHQNRNLFKFKKNHRKGFSPPTSKIANISSWRSSLTPLIQFLASWALIALNIYIIDLVVVAKHIRLQDGVILWIIFCGFIIPIALLLSLFRDKRKRILTQAISIFLVALTQLLIISSYPTETYSQIWTWMPSLFIGVTAVIVALPRKSTV